MICKEELKTPSRHLVATAFGLILLLGGCSLLVGDGPRDISPLPEIKKMGVMMSRIRM